jgi:anti-anti-sigma regulatory factor
VLCGITPRLLSLLQLTHVDKLFHIFDNVEEAVSGLATRA